MQSTKSEKVRDTAEDQDVDDEEFDQHSDLSHRSHLKSDKSDKARAAEEVQDVDDDDEFERHSRLSHHKHLKSSKRLEEVIDLDDDDDYELASESTGNRNYFRSDESSTSSKKETGPVARRNTHLLDEDGDLESGRGSSSGTNMTTAGHCVCESPTCKKPVQLFLFNMKNSEQKVVRKCLCCAVRDPAFLQRGLLMSLVVGTSLTLINNGDMLFSGNLRADLAWKIILTYLVPFCVASYASLATVRIKIDSVENEIRL